MIFEKVKYLRIFLILIALHSFIVGINLIFIPPDLMGVFGFEQITEHFFKVQGGVFHLIMTMAYSMGAYKPIKFRIIIQFSLIAKTIASVFLFSYYFIVSSVFTILMSGVGDFTMAIILFVFYNKLFIKSNSDNTNA